MGTLKSGLEKMNVKRLFNLKKMAHDLSELRHASRITSRTHTITYTVVCKTDEKDHKEESVTATGDSLGEAVTRAADEFTLTNKDHDWQVAWSASCTVARKDGSWQLSCQVPQEELLEYIPKPTSK